MRIFPAIDLRGSKVVRLTEGDYGRMDTYSDNPAQIAEEFSGCGAKYLHMVDLDGAKDGVHANLSAMKAVCGVKGLFVQASGGVRDEKRLCDLLNIGVGRVILGTAAINNYPFVEAMAAKYGEKIAVGVDAKGGKVAIRGWTEVTDVDAMDFCKKLRDDGISTVIYTDISRDGMMQGANISAYEKLSQISGLNIIASGGITFESEIARLKDSGIYGAILGKALYEGKLNLKRAIEIGGGKSNI